MIRDSEIRIRRRDRGFASDRRIIAWNDGKSAVNLSYLELVGSQAQSYPDKHTITSVQTRRRQRSILLFRLGCSTRDENILPLVLQQANSP